LRQGRQGSSCKHPPLEVTVGGPFEVPCLAFIPCGEQVRRLLGQVSEQKRLLLAQDDELRLQPQVGRLQTLVPRIADEGRKQLSAGALSALFDDRSGQSNGREGDPIAFRSDA